MPAAEITLDQLLAEYDQLRLTTDDDGLTTDEFATLWNVSYDRALSLLKRFDKAGWVRRGVKTILRFNGRSMRTSCYWLVVPKAKGKRSRR